MPSRGATDTSVWKVEILPGAPATPHSLTREEVFVVLEGAASVRIAGSETRAAAGDAIVVPADAEFELANAGAGRCGCCAELMGMTKQAASKLVDAMVSSGYIQRGTNPQDGRQRPVTLTGRGEELLSAVEQVYAEFEDGWARLIGTSHLDRMRQDLMHILSGPGNGQLPPVRPTW